MRDCGCIGSLNTYPKNSKNRKRMFHLEFFKKFVKPKFSIFLIFFLSIFEFFFTCFFYANRKKSITLKKIYGHFKNIQLVFFLCSTKKEKSTIYATESNCDIYFSHILVQKWKYSAKINSILDFFQGGKNFKKTLILVCFQ